MPTEYPVHLAGGMGWTAKQADARRVVLRSENELSLDFEYCGYHYSAELQRNESGGFEGQYQIDGGGRGGSASCELYPSAKGYLLFGRWDEGGTLYHWWAELETIAPS